MGETREQARVFPGSRTYSRKFFLRPDTGLPTTAFLRYHPTQQDYPQCDIGTFTILS